MSPSSFQDETQDDLGNNILGFVPYMGLFLTNNHRAVDGGPATLFLKETKEQIEKISY